MFVLIYDENDGLFDHVPPPTAPAGTADEYITVDGAADPIGLGFRVPCVVVSPWTVGGYVSHYDLRPHLGDPAARIGDRGGLPQHQRLAAPDGR